MTVGELLAACLADGGVRAVYGAPLAGSTLRHVPVADPALAALLADADGAVGPAPGAALLPGDPPLLRVGARPGAVVQDPVVIDDAADVAVAVRAAIDAAWERPGCTALALAVDLEAPAPPAAEPVPHLVAAVALAVPPDELTGPVVVLAGPGVVRTGRAGALRRLAARAGVGVLNTWGAKGLFPWDSPHHLGTAGLQAHDFDLAGLGDAGLIVATGIDPAEAPRYRWAGDGGRDVGIPPWYLDGVADTWPFEPPPDIPRPRLYTELAAALAPHYAGAEPGSPALAVTAVKADLPPGGLVAADPGPAGLWIARTFPTDVLGSVCVPAVAADGFAVAAAIAAGLAGRPAIAVTTEPVDATSARLLELADQLGVAVDLRVWGPSTGVDFAHTRVLEAVAGPVVAWE